MNTRKDVLDSANAFNDTFAPIVSKAKLVLENAQSPEAKQGMIDVWSCTRLPHHSHLHYLLCCFSAYCSIISKLFFIFDQKQWCAFELKNLWNELVMF